MKLFTPASWKNIIATLCIVTIEKFELTLLPQQTHQRWNTVDRQRSSTLFQHWYLVENESWAKVHLSTLFQRWNNVDRITLIQRRWTNVVSTLKFGWKWKLSRRMFIGVASTLRKQHLNTLSIVILMFTRKWLKNKIKLSFQV